MKVEQAIGLARPFHEGQFDKAGRPYLDHVLRVMDAVATEDEKLAAVMHDLMEDTVLTRTDLLCAGVPTRIADSVEALTRHEGEDYEDFVIRAVRDRIARAVKLADLTDNADEGRLALLDPAEAARLRTKYATARSLLESLEPLDEKERQAERAARTGVPIGATELGIPKGPDEAWATFWCALPNCGRPAGTLTLVHHDEPNLFGYVGYSLVLTTFLGTMAPPVSDEEVDVVRDALGKNDAVFFYRRSPELAPFWCPTCRQTYCNSHWQQVTLMDDGYFDCIDGTCPEGHTRELWD